MEKQSVLNVPIDKQNAWRKEAEKHSLSKKYIAEHCFSNFRTIHNALVLGLASKKTQAMLDSFFSSLNTKK